MNSINASLISISIVSTVIAVISICFPNNKYRCLLITLSKIIIVSIIILSLTSIDFNLNFNNTEITVNESLFNDMVNDKIKTDINEYVETVYDTTCETEINNSEIILYISQGDENQIKNAVYQKFGLECRVKNIE